MGKSARLSDSTARSLTIVFVQRDGLRARLGRPIFYGTPPILTKSIRQTTSSTGRRRCSSITTPSKRPILTPRNGGNGRWISYRSRIFTRIIAYNQSDNSACCVYEITSMPNPFILWFGLITRPIGRRAGVARTQQRLRVDRADVSSAVASVDEVAANHLRLPLLRRHPVDLFVQRDRAAASLAMGNAPRNDGKAAGSAALPSARTPRLPSRCFAYFYPILAAYPISWNAWHQRMWFGHWVIWSGIAKRQAARSQRCRDIRSGITSS